MHQNRRNRAAPFVEVSFDGNALGRHVRIGPQVERSISGQHDGFEKTLQPITGHGRDIDELGLAAILFRHQAELRQLPTDSRRICCGLVDLVDGNHDGHIRGLGVVQRLDGLRHHTVIGGNHQHRDIRRLGTTGTHGRKRLVAGGIDEGDSTLFAVHLGLNLIGADSLRDATGLPRHHVGVPQSIEEFRLAVIDMPHDGDHGRSGPQVLLTTDVLPELQVKGFEQLAILVLGGNHLDVVVQLGAQHLERVISH